MASGEIQDLLTTKNDNFWPGAIDFDENTVIENDDIVILEDVEALWQGIVGVLHTPRGAIDGVGLEKYGSQVLSLRGMNLTPEIKELAKNSVDESELNIRAVEDVFQGFFCELPVDQFESQNEVVDELSKLLKFKEKTNAARKPPKIILVAPPCSGKMSIVNRIARKLQIIPVNILDLLNKEIANKNENSLEILNAIQNNELVSDKYILKLLEDRLYCSDCMINGWIVTGFPKSQGQVNFLESMKAAIKPSLIALIDMDEKLIEEKAKKIKFDPKTGKYYREDSKKYAKLTEDVVNRLVSRPQDSEEILKKRIECWKGIKEIVQTKLTSNDLSLNGEDKKKKICQLIEDKVQYNS